MDFKKLAPHLKLLIRTSGSANHQVALETGALDILVDAEPRVLGDFVSWTLYEDRFNFYRFKGNTNTPLFPDSIDSVPLIFCPSAFDAESKGILDHLEEKGFFFKERIELDSFTAVQTFCKAQLGIAVLPQRLAHQSLKNKELTLVHLQGFPSKGFGPHSICASVKANRSDDNRIRLLVKALKDRYKS